MVQFPLHRRGNFFLSFFMINRLLLLCFLLAILTTSCSDDVRPDESAIHTPNVKTGAVTLLENHLDELEGKRIGLVMNPTARVGSSHMLDTLLSRNVNVTALFAPEHGFRGDRGAGEIIEDGIDRTTGLPVFSLYGSTRKPTYEMMETVDLLLFDMQDVGARFYTYNSTLGLVLEAASETGVDVWLLDRPNPAGGNYVSGWIMEEEFKSFVGMYPIPVAHGLTLGELGKMMIGEKWLSFDEEPNFKVIPMQGWSRTMKWPDTGLYWIPPSPNLPTFEHAFVYLGTCFVEGTSLSEGRGTENPFLILGSPETELTTESLLRLNNSIGYANIESTTFIPVEISGVATNPKHEGELSKGVRIHVDSYNYDPVRSGLLILRELMERSEGASTNMFLYNLTGTREIDSILKGVNNPMEVDFGLEEFISKRADYLIYE